MLVHFGGGKELNPRLAMWHNDLRAIVTKL